MGEKNNTTIVFAIPTYNEADTVGQLTQVIDKGLSTYFGGYNLIIVNADKNSPDNTRGAFLKTATKSKKVYLNSADQNPKINGKGFEMRMAFEYAHKIGADALGFIDGDVTSATPLWVRKLIGPILKGYDHVLPIYLRNEYDGSITNNLVFPVLYGLVSTKLRQPLAGEIALSKRAVDKLLSVKWYNNAYLFGIDIFMVTQSIFNNFHIGQTYLGIKAHKPSAPKLMNMFIEVADSLFRQIKTHQEWWNKRRVPSRSAPLLSQPKMKYHTPEIAFDYKGMRELVLDEYSRRSKQIAKLFPSSLAKELKKSFNKKRPFNVSDELWARAVYAMISKKRIFSRAELCAFRTIYFARFLTFYRETLDATHEESEKIIQKQTRLFRKMRNLALD